MQELRFVAVSEDGSYAVLAVPGRSARFTLPIDERLRAVALGQTSRLAQYEIEVESPLRPKEIQARIRAGETAEEIADAAGLPVERVRWFEGPVLAERAYIATQAQAASVRRPGDPGPGPRLGDIVPDRISMLGGDPQDAEWDSRKRGDGSWQVSLTFTSGGRLHVAEWMFDPRRRHVAPADEAAERLCLPESELPPIAASIPGEATVTPLAPRLGAVAGGGAAGYGPGGYGTPGGAAGGGARFRPDRPAPDRYPHEFTAPEPHATDRHPAAAADWQAAERYSSERHLAERPGSERHSPDRRAGNERPAAPESPAGYAPQPPASYAAPPPAAYTQPPRPPQPPAHTLRPGHGLVPMWDPPAWNPDPGPEPARHVASDSQAPAAPRLEQSHAPVPPAAPPAPEWAADDVASAHQDMEHAPPYAELTFEDPEPVLAQSVTAAEATADDWAAPEPVAAPAAPAPVAARPVAPPRQAPPPEPVAAPKPVATPKPAPLAEPVVAPASPVAEPVTELVAQTVVEQPQAVITPPATVVEPEPEPAPEPAKTAEPSKTAEPAKAPEPAKAREPAKVEEPAAKAEEPAKDEEPAKAEEPEPAAEESRPRPAKGPKAKGRRSSVPSWDEIMLGSSRQRD